MIKLEWVCDDTQDCYDGSDEWDCYSYNCVPGMQKCYNGRQCVNDIDICDGERHCHDESDEVGFIDCDNWNCAGDMVTGTGKALSFPCLFLEI